MPRVFGYPIIGVGYNPYMFGGYGFHHHHYPYFGGFGYGFHHPWHHHGYGW
ncbi:hypothetical protein [Bacillus salipaludis]|uniref:hypothetical protein n=1 Tax=Bacillus salipaludis TaxID=2547811 RepID=UPI001404C7AC|nr:hypothetical protein [Bacillus salipaludis]